MFHLIVNSSLLPLQYASFKYILKFSLLDCAPLSMMVKHQTETLKTDRKNAKQIHAIEYKQH